MIIEFNGKSFCFTGLLAQLKRSHAEREVRARYGFTQKIVNPALDYLVVGSIPSIGWKYGSYGNKIEQALDFKKNRNCVLQLISEHVFMEALENTPSLSAGEIEGKLLVIKYKSLVMLGNYDHDAIETLLAALDDLGFHVTASLEPPFVYQDLYNQFQGQNLQNLMYLNLRFVKALHIDEDSQSIMDEIAIYLERIKGLDGDISFSEKKEGTASFTTLLNSIPQTLKLEK